MAPVIRCLPWSEPPLVSAAARLLDETGPNELGAIDLRAIAVLLPGARAARRLLELLVEGAAQRELRLVPPRLATPSALPGLLGGAGIEKSLATALEAQLAWIHALRGARAETLQAAFGVGLAEQRSELDAAAGWALAEELAEVAAELHGAGLDGAAVLRAVAHEPVAAAWAAFAELEQGARRALQAVGRDFEGCALREAVLRSEPDEDGAQRLVAIAIAEWSPLARAALRSAPLPIELWIHAREDELALFDELGTPLVAAWAERALDLPAERLLAADQPADQAGAAIGSLRAMAQGAPLDEVALGVLDPKLAPFLAHELAGHGLEAHDAAGTPVARSAPHTLLAALAKWRETRGFAELARIARHPHAALALGTTAERFEDAALLSAALDRHWRAHLQTGRDPEGWLSGESGDERETSALLERATNALDAKLAAFRSERRPLDAWCEALRELLLALYGERAALDHETSTALERLAAALHELDEVPRELASETSGGEALALLLARAEEAAPIPPPPRERALDLLGPLELHLEEAPVLVVVGANEGRFPAARYADRWLPDALRRRLGLPDAQQRTARDTYLLAAMLAPRRDWRVVYGRRSVEDDALLPSRVLLRARREYLGERVTSLLERAPYARPPGSGPRGPRENGSALEVPRPRPLDERQRRRLETLPVSAFRAYLACPYRFYLRYALGLEVLDDRLDEMDGRLFGTLAHAVLQRFGESEVRAIGDEEQLHAWLSACLEDEARARFGARPLIAVSVQVEMLRKRLGAFACWQAGRAREGWRIVAVEHEARATLATSVGEIAFRGRIDRIDARGEELCVLDYKTGERALGVREAHGALEGERWIWSDLQLPLYHVFARELASRDGLRGAIHLGYLRLPRKLGESGVDLAGWSAEELDEALREAARVAEAIRAERFWPPNPDYPLGGDDFAALCQRRSVLLSSAAEEEQESEEVSA